MNGPCDTVYNRAVSGWFKAQIFEDWFLQIAVPYFRRLSGLKVIIGDNLASHITYRIIKKCKDEDIRFILLPPNATHLCQTLDVSVVRPLKLNWRQVIRKWKMKNRGALPKSVFPALLAQAIKLTEGMQANIISGFRATGISPLNRQKVLRSLPEAEEPSQENIVRQMLGPVIDLLQKHRFPEQTTQSRGRKKINTPAGRAVRLEDFQQLEAENMELKTVTVK